MPTRPTYYLICTHMESISTKTASQNSNGISKMRPENVEVDQPRSPAQSPQITKPIQTAQIAKVAQPRNTRPIPATSAAFTKSTANSIWSHRTRQATAMATSVSNRAPNSNQIPVVFATEEDFANFPKFIVKLEKAHDAMKYGAVKVVAPYSWKMEVAKTYKNVNLLIPGTRIQSTTKTNSNGTYKQYQRRSNKKMSFNEFEKEANKEANREPQSENYIDLDRKYWDSVKCGKHEPIYADGFEGTLFDANYTKWNLNKLGDILCDLPPKTYPGITNPFLYIGTWRSSFAWHTEDKDLYSVSYLHFGKPKTWYIVPPVYGKRLEKLCPRDHELCPAHLRHKCTLIEPNELRRHDIPVFEAVQEIGQFVITFPYAYHSGYNHGYNCAEAVNFASSEWVKFGVCATSCVCSLKPKNEIDMKPFVAKYLKNQYKDWLEIGERIFEQRPQDMQEPPPTGPMGPVMSTSSKLKLGFSTT